MRKLLTVLPVSTFVPFFLIMLCGLNIECRLILYCALHPGDFFRENLLACSI